MSDPVAPGLAELVERLEVVPTIMLPAYESSLAIDTAKTIRQMMVERAEAASALRSLASRAEELEREVASLAAHNDKLQGDIGPMIARITELERERVALLETLMVDDDETLVEVAKQIIESRNDLGNEHARLVGKVDELEREKDGLAKGAQITNDALDMAVKDVNRLEAELSRLKGKVEEAGKHLAVLSDPHRSGNSYPLAGGNHLHPEVSAARAFLASLNPVPDKQETPK